MRHSGLVIWVMALAAVLAPAAQAGLIGLYAFDDGTAQNQVSGAGALPDLNVHNVTFAGGSATFDATSDYLELPVALGSGPFTIYIDATYDPYPNDPNLAVSQLANAASPNVDFFIQQFPGTSNDAGFYNGEGLGTYVVNGSFDGSEHRIAITWDGSTLGNFFDGTLQTATVGGTLPDIDGSVVRFGDRTGNDHIGMTGTVREIRIYDEALSEDQLRSVSVVPEPASMGLLALGGLALCRRRRRRRA